MSRHVLMLMGVPVRVEPDHPERVGCKSCVFLKTRSGCPVKEEEEAQGVIPCWHGAGHYYVKAESWRAPS